MPLSQPNVVPLDRILVIDDLPLIPLAFQEIFRSLNPAARVEYSGNIFTALSAKAFAGTRFDLIIAGTFQDGYNKDLLQAVAELKERFGRPLVIIYSSSYHPLIIEKMSEAGIDAYVHRYESADEIRRAYQQLASGRPFVSEMFHTLYYDYGLR